MKRTSLGLAFAALLYGAIGLTANAVDVARAGGPTPDLSAAEIDSLKALRAGDMAKLVIHDAPRPRIEEAYRDQYGNKVTLADHAGKVVLLNIWATWCPPCRAEMPSLDRLAGDLAGPDFEVVALSTDRGGAERVAEFYKQIQVYKLDVMMDRSGDVSRRAGVLGLPATLILDRQGREIGRLMGDADWDSPEARSLIRRVIELTREGTSTVRT